VQFEVTVAALEDKIVQAAVVAILTPTAAAAITTSVARDIYRAMSLCGPALLVTQDQKRNLP
jgi:hypothetical protein